VSAGSCSAALAAFPLSVFVNLRNGGNFKNLPPLQTKPYPPGKRTPHGEVQERRNAPEGLELGVGRGQLLQVVLDKVEPAHMARGRST